MYIYSEKKRSCEIPYRLSSMETEMPSVPAAGAAPDLKKDAVEFPTSGAQDDKPEDSAYLSKSSIFYKEIRHFPKFFFQFGKKFKKIELFFRLFRKKFNFF